MGIWSVDTWIEILLNLSTNFQLVVHGNLLSLYLRDVHVVDSVMPDFKRVTGLSHLFIADNFYQADDVSISNLSLLEITDYPFSRGLASDSPAESSKSSLVQMCNDSSKNEKQKKVITGTAVGGSGAAIGLAGAFLLFFLKRRRTVTTTQMRVNRMTLQSVAEQTPFYFKHQGD